MSTRSRPTVDVVWRADTCSGTGGAASERWPSPSRSRPQRAGRADRPDTHEWPSWASLAGDPGYGTLAPAASGPALGRRRGLDGAARSGPSAPPAWPSFVAPAIIPANASFASSTVPSSVDDDHAERGMGEGAVEALLALVARSGGPAGVGHVVRQFGAPPARHPLWIKPRTRSSLPARRKSRPVSSRPEARLGVSTRCTRDPAPGCPPRSSRAAGGHRLSAAAN